MRQDFSLSDLRTSSPEVLKWFDVMFRQQLRHITPEQLLHLDTRQVVYLKSGMRDGESAFVLYGADGTPLVTLDTLEEVVQMVAENGLSFASVH